MTKQQKRDWFGIGLLAVHAAIFLIILVPTFLNVESQELLVEFRYNFLKNFVGKVEWYWRYLPALTSLLILITNAYIWHSSNKTSNRDVIRFYLVCSLVPQVFLAVVVFAMLAALF